MKQNKRSPWNQFYAGQYTQYKPLVKAVESTGNKLVSKVGSQLLSTVSRKPQLNNSQKIYRDLLGFMSSKVKERQHALGVSEEKLMLILSGVAEVVFTDEHGQKHAVFELRCGDIFGIADLIQAAVSISLASYCVRALPFTAIFMPKRTARCH